jgi:hypothetical protein
MLTGFSAELNGVELIWIDQPPTNLSQARVLVGFDDAGALPDSQAVPSRRYEFADLVGKLQWRGDAVKEQRGWRDSW